MMYELQREMICDTQMEDKSYQQMEIAMLKDVSKVSIRSIRSKLGTNTWINGLAAFWI